MRQKRGLSALSDEVLDSMPAFPMDKDVHQWWHAEEFAKRLKNSLPIAGEREIMQALRQAYQGEVGEAIWKATQNWIKEGGLN